MRRILLVLTVLAGLAACGSPPHAAPVGPQSRGRDTVSLDVDGRPFLMHVPSSYQQGSAVPLVVALHGYTSNGAQFDQYFGLSAQSDARGFLLATPDGTRDRGGSTYWNATDACCDFYRSGVDDSAYLSHLIATVERYYTVDRVFLTGHSNGAFMSFRMACEHADQLTAIVGLNGAMWNDKAKCRPSRPVSVLDIRSTGDGTIQYGGGVNGPDSVPYPSAETTDADWREFDRCDPQPKPGQPLDLVADLAGAETVVTSWSCADRSTVASWRIEGGSHSPTLSGAFAADVVDFMYAQGAA